MEKPDKVTFHFTRDEGYRFAAVNGVWGGPTPRGDIRVDFFYEHQPVPELVAQAIPDGRPGPELERRPDPKQFERTVVFGMMLTPEQAVSIGEWLMEKGKLARVLRKAAVTSEDADVANSSKH